MVHSVWIVDLEGHSQGHNGQMYVISYIKLSFYWLSGKHMLNQLLQTIVSQEAF